MKKQTLGILAVCLACSAITSAANNDVPDYKVDSTFDQTELQTIPVGIAVSQQDKIHVLLANGSVKTCDLSGKTSGGFESKMQPTPSVIVEEKGKIYLLATDYKQQEVEFQGKKRMMNQASGVKCAVFSADGMKESEFTLPELVSAKDAHFVGGKLVVGDLSRRQITYFDLSKDAAKMDSELKGEFRLCCGIFDFCPTADGNSIFVANLGAFKVQEFSKGRKSSEFGARGSKLEEFHGCCNPVNVAALGEKFIVTVEKSPTRVKICDTKGKDAKIIEGVGELVNGCSVIPVAVDRKGAIYLASATKRCVVKCVTDAAVSGLPTGSGAKDAGVGAAKTSPRELSASRTWENAETGKKITGTLVAYEGVEAAEALEQNGKIRLLVGAKTFELPLARLSQADQEFVGNLRKQFTATTAQ